MSTDTLAEQVNLKKNKNLIGKEKAEKVKKNWFIVPTPDNSEMATQRS